MKPLLGKCLSAALLCFAAGCVNVDYVGQTFPPTPEGSPVLCFCSREEIQPGKYRIIGRGIFTTTRRLDKYDIQEILTDEGRKRGADAVVLEIDMNAASASVCTEAVKLNLISANGARTIRLTVPMDANLTMTTSARAFSTDARNE